MIEFKQEKIIRSNVLLQSSIEATSILGLVYVKIDPVFCEDLKKTRFKKVFA
jgi:hypothetical protein